MATGAGEGGGSPTGVKPGALTDLLRHVAAAPEGRDVEAPPLQPGAVVGRFEILRELGRGGFGVVYEARDRELGRQVALKLVRAGRADLEEGKVLREAEAIARLSHPNLITLHDVGRSEQGPYLVFELLRGKTLQERIDDGPLPLQEAVHVAVEVARGLAHAHGEGVVHRDLKPSNVFVTVKGQVKILDFGMAHAFGRRRLSGGTPAYMAPEQWEDDPEDERTDLFALGVMLHVMLSGEYPFPEGEGRWSAGPAITPKLDLPAAPGLAELISGLLQKAPKGRPRDGAAALAALMPIEDGLRTRPADGAPPSHARRRKATLGERVAGLRRRRGLQVTAAMALVAALAGTGWYAWKRISEARSTTATTSVVPSIAVLPFADLSPGKDQEYFSDGVAEEILSALSKVVGLRVPGRSSSFYFKKKDVPPAEIARKLGVVHLLEGSVRRSGTKLRISAELVRAADGERLWSQAFDREDRDLFAVQDEIARAVVEALRLQFLPRQGSGVAQRRPTNPESYRLYLLGKQLMWKETVEGIEGGFRALDEALRLDPSYLPARAWRAYARFLMANVILPGDPARPGQSALDYVDANQAALREAEEIVAAAPDAFAAYWVRGALRAAVAFDFAGAIEDHRRALALEPGDVRTKLDLARALASTGQLPEAQALALQAAEADPMEADAYRGLGIIQAASGNPDLAAVTFRRGLEVSPGHSRLLRELGIAYLLSGRSEESLPIFEASPAGWVRDLGQALAYHQLGRDADSRAALGRLVADNDRGATFAYQIAQVHAWRGERDEAFRWLEKALAARDGGMTHLRYDPLLRNLRSDPRYAALLRTMKLLVDGGSAPPRPAEITASPSIAVLPFADMSEKHDQEYFADGIAEEIRNALSHIEGLKVIGRSSSFSFKGKTGDLKAVGVRLGVANVLEGSLRTEGNSLRITAQLIRVADGTHLWSESYDRKQAGVFKVQDDIASAVVGALKVKLLPGESADSRATRTDNPEAYKEHLLGRRLLTQFSAESGRRAIQAFERAVRLDPGYAPAWGGLSAALTSNAENNGTVLEAMADRRRALEAANRAVALAPALADGYLARANLVDIRGWDWPGAIADSARAVQLSPRDAAARTTHGMLLAESGREREGILELERATELDPLSAEAWAQFGWFASGDQKRRAFDRAREISPDNAYASIPGGPMSREQALATIGKKPGRNDSNGYVALIRAHLVLEQRAEANKALGELLACCSHNGAWQVAIAYDDLGDRDRAFEWLDRARVQLDSGIRYLRYEREFRGDPRTAEILKKMNLPVN